MQIVIPMAGRGERFLKAGFKEPKPLIEVLEKPMIEHVINFFPKNSNFLFICNNGHLQNTNLENVLKRIAPESKIVGINSHKLGPVQSILEVEDYILDDEKILISYCDFSIIWDHQDFLKKVSESDIKSASICYKGFHPHLVGPNVYAGVRVGENNEVLEVREKHSFTKDKMDTWQQAGVFYFDSGKLLKNYSKYIVENNIRCNGEHYLSLLFNSMIRDGHKSIVYPAEFFCQWGTPEDLKQFNEWINLAKERNFVNPESEEENDKIVRYWQYYLNKNNKNA